MEAQQGSPTSMLVIFALFGLIFYFMIYRPQAKRNKEFAQLQSGLKKGSEVLTSGGLIGKITKISPDDDQVTIALNDTVEVRIKRNFIVHELQTGTQQALNKK